MFCIASVLLTSDETVLCCIWCAGGNTTGNYQILTPAYYDQSGQFVVSGNAARTPVRLVSPAPILVNTATGQQGMFCCIVTWFL